MNTDNNEKEKNRTLITKELEHGLFNLVEFVKIRVICNF